jgi:ABC-type uncharacterized transport system ATPase component
VNYAYVILFSSLDVLAYLIARIDKMQEQNLAAVTMIEETQRHCVRSVGSISIAENLKIWLLRKKKVRSPKRRSAQKKQ